MFVSDVLSRADETDTTSEIPELEMQHSVQSIASNNNFNQRLEKTQ